MQTLEDVLAIEPNTYSQWQKEGALFDPVALLERARSPEAAARLTPGRKSVGDIAVMKVSGFISQKPTIWSELFGGTSTEEIASAVRAAMAEPSIGAVVLDVDSPGGAVFGLTEAAAVLRSVRGSKPLIAVSNSLMASAAYWLGSQADEVVASPSSITGSIGVMAVYVDHSKEIEQAGLGVEEIVSAPRKAEGSGVKPLTTDARATIQARVDRYGAMFETDVARGRGVSPAKVRARYGQGVTFTAEDAKAAGLVDRVASFEDTVGRLAAGHRPRPRLAAEMDPVEMAARAMLAGLTSPPGSLE